MNCTKFDTIVLCLFGEVASQGAEQLLIAQSPSYAQFHFAFDLSESEK